MCIYNIYVYIYILLQPSIPYELGLSTGPPPNLWAKKPCTAGAHGRTFLRAHADTPGPQCANSECLR